jgi:hypothetical protein
MSCGSACDSCERNALASNGGSCAAALNTASQACGTSACSCRLRDCGSLLYEDYRKLPAAAARVLYVANMNEQRQDTRRGFLSRLLGGSAVLALAGSAGCVAPGVSGAQGSEGPVELVPIREGLRYFNTLPTSIPAVRMSPAVAPDWSHSKAFE